MREFKTKSQFLGYINKQDITNADPRFMIPGSQNVIINDGEKISIRQGYTLDGSADSAFTPNTASYDWNTSTGVERNIKAFEDTLQYRYVDSTGTVTWRDLETGFSDAVNFQFAEFYDATTEKKDLLLFVNGTSNIYMWSGGVTTFASATVNTITKQGSTTWAEERFLLAGTRRVIIGGIAYTYTGGESTTTLTGVTPNPTTGGHTAGDVVHQQIRTTANTPASGFGNDIIAHNNNYIFVASYDRRDIYISKNTDYTSYTFSSPRTPGEGAILTLDSNPIGFAIQEQNTYVFGSKNDIYQCVFTLSADLTTESVNVQRLNSGPGQGALATSAIAKIKNSVVYLTNEYSIDTLGRVEYINTPQSRPISDPVKLEFLGYSYDISPHILYFQNRTYIAVPSESKVMIYDHERNMWFPPQIMPVRRFAIIGNELYFHSSQTPETFKAFDGTNDNGNPIDARARFVYDLYGNRTWKKEFDEWFTEAYIATNTVLFETHYFDYSGTSGIREYLIDGSDLDLIYGTTQDNSLGKQSLGKLGVGSITDESSVLNKLRHIKTMSKIDFFEHSIEYSSNQLDAQWELLCFGGNVQLSTIDNAEIKR